MSGRLWLRSPFDPSTPLRIRVSGKGGISFIERALYGDGALQSPHRRGERGHEAVAHRLHLGAAVGAEALAGDALVLPQDLARLRVAQALGEGGGAFDVGEEDGEDVF